VTTVAVTVRAAGSTSVTVPRHTSTLRCPRRIRRVVGAISPGARIPVATWYSSGWNR
jgi:hypothetical protein